MIQAVNTPTTSNLVPLASSYSGGRALACRSCSQGSDDTGGADELSLSQPGSLASLGGTYERTSLQIRSRSATNVAEDGDTRFASQTKLRFSYDFQAADGTSIHIRTQANLNYAQTTDSEDGSQSMKLRVAARVAILQENVSSGTAPLLDSSEISPDTQEFISQAIEMFQRTIDGLATALGNSDPLDGDSLITGLVAAFNDLSAAVDELFFSPSTDNEAVPAETTAALLAQPTANTTGVPVSESTPTIDVTPISVPSTPLIVDLTPDTTPPSTTESEPSDTTSQDEAATTAISELPVTNQEEEVASSDQQAASAAGSTTASFVNSVMLRVRVQMMQSLHSVVDAFSTDSAESQVTQSSFRATAKLSAHFSMTAFSANAAQPLSNGIDASV